MPLGFFNNLLQPGGARMLRISGIPLDFEADDIAEAFTDKGFPVVKCVILPSSSLEWNEAHVEFGNERACRIAAHRFHGCTVNGRRLEIAMVRYL